LPSPQLDFLAGIPVRLEKMAFIQDALEMVANNQVLGVN
jgi:hypothetical protein